MLLESETNVTLALAGAAAVLLLFTLLFLVLWRRAAGILHRTTEDLSKTEVGADRTERRLFNILQAIPVAIVETDTSGKFTFANRAAHQLLGRKDAELIGLRFHSATWGITYPDGRLIPPDLLPAARALRGQTVKGFQHLMVNPNTHKKMLVSVTAQPILDEMGEVIGSSSAMVETESLSTPQPTAEDLLRTRYFDIAAVMLLALGRDGRIRDINPLGAETLGLTVETAVGRDWINEFLPEQDRKDARAVFEDIVEGRREMPEYGEGWIIRADGQRRLISWRGSVLRDERDRIVATLSSGRDVTDVRQAQRATREAEDSLRLAQEAGDVGVWSVNRTTGEVRNSDSMATVWGLKAEDMDGVARQLDMVHPDDRTAVDEAIAAVREGRSTRYRGEFRVLQPGGRTVWLAAHGEPILDDDGATVGLRGVNYDISALKAAQAAAQESEHRFGDVADAAPVLIWIAGADRLRTWFNRPWLEFTGLSLAQAQSDGWTQAVHPDDLDAYQRALATAFEHTEPFRHQYRLRRHDGEWRCIEEAGAARHDADGGSPGFVGGGVDVTEHRDTAEALRASEERSRSQLEALESRLEERSRALEESVEDRRKTEEALEQAQRLETVGRLTGGLAHDFNNLITTVIGALDMVLRQADQPDRVRRLGEAALAASKRGEQLTRQLLAFSKRDEFQTETLELGTTIRGYEGMIRRAAGDRATVSVETLPGLGPAEFDAVQLEAALLNLVTNAREAMGEEGGAMTLKAEPVELGPDDLTDVRAGAYAKISVSDSGPGMAPEVAARAFEPFYTTGQGTGLGLAQVYGFARQSGGGVKVDSTPGQGATVSIFLPIQAESAGARSELAQTGEAEPAPADD